MLNNNSIMDEATPLQFRLSQNYPNPFKDKTVIKYCVAYKTNVQITVYDSEGNVVEKLVDEEKKPGTYEVEFQLGIEGGELEVGNYYYRLKAGEYRSEKKMIIKK